MSYKFLPSQGFVLGKPFTDQGIVVDKGRFLNDDNSMVYEILESGSSEYIIGDLILADQFHKKIPLNINNTEDNYVIGVDEIFGIIKAVSDES